MFLPQIKADKYFNPLSVCNKKLQAEGLLVALFGFTFSLVLCPLSILSGFEINTGETLLTCQCTSEEFKTALEQYEAVSIREMSAN